jgi:hypothetical protein
MVHVEIRQVENGWLVIGQLGKMSSEEFIASTPKEALAFAEKFLTAYGDWREQMYPDQK